MNRQTENRPGTRSGTAKKIQADDASASVSPTVPVPDPVWPWLMAVRTVVSHVDGRKYVRFHKTVSPANVLAVQVNAHSLLDDGISSMTSIAYLTRTGASDADAFVVFAENKLHRLTTTIFTTADSALEKAQRHQQRGQYVVVIPCKSWPTQPRIGDFR